MQWAILEGDTKTGITTMQMDVGLDTGDMLLKKEVEIAPDETGESLHDKLAAIGSDILLQTLADAQEGNLHPQKQDEKESTYAPMLKKEMGEMDFSWDAKKLERYVRGLNSWPCAYTGIRGKMLKVWRVGTTDENTGEKPGTVVDVGKDRFTVQTGDGCLELFEVQMAGKKRMDTGSFLRGVSIEKGDVLCL